jgi:hypothetical protein
MPVATNEEAIFAVANRGDELIGVWDWCERSATFLGSDIDG